MDQHFSHDIVAVEPRHTVPGSQEPVRADHERNVHFNSARETALVLGFTRGSARTEDALQITLVPEGSNHLLDPPRLRIAPLGQTGVLVSVESLLFAIKQLQGGG